MLTQPTVEQMQSLGLVEMARAWQAQQKDPEAAQLSFDERLALLVDAQHLHNFNKRTARLLAETKLRLPQACIEDVDFPKSRDLDRPLWRQLCTGRFIDDKRGILIIGATGTGKTYLACALGQQACRQGRRVRYYRTSRLLEELAVARADGPWNQDLGSTIFPGIQSTDVSYPAGSLLLDLGTLVSRRYCLTGLGDAQCDTPASQAPYHLRQVSFDSKTGQRVADDLYPQIVQLQAVYGIDTSVTADQVADVWTPASPTTAKGWQRVVAVRVAVVARSTQNEQRPNTAGKEWVTADRPVWYPDGVTPTPLHVDKAPPGAGDDWRNYRYKVFETVIPLRNLLWQPA